MNDDQEEIKMHEPNIIRNESSSEERGFAPVAAQPTYSVGVT